MNIKKVLVAILMVMIVLGLGASYIFSGRVPVQQPDETQSEPTVTATKPAPANTFKNPTGQPTFKGPSVPAK